MIDTIHDITDHLKVYLVAGTFVALGVDVAGNVTETMGSAISGAMQAMPMPQAVVSHPTAVLIRGIGAMIAVVGAALYLGNMWCGYVALRQFRFNFKERGLLLKACGWSAAFLYVVVCAVIGVAVNAVYLALVN